MAYKTRMKYKEIDPKRLKDVLDWDDSKKELIWKHRGEEFFHKKIGMATWNKKNSGKVAMPSTDKYGYRAGCLFGAVVFHHTVVWAYHKGFWPKSIDHIDGNKTNNSIENLREADALENSRNRKKPVNNTSGYVGVSWHKADKKWRASIRDRYKTISLGSFEKIEDAAEARKIAEMEFGYSKNHGR